MALEQKQAEPLRQGFKKFNRFMLLMWRLGLGREVNIWPEVGGRIMVLTHTGRKSGLQRRTPVNYAVVNGEVYCTAGFGSVSDWYRNVKANPNVEIWLPDGWWEGTAEEVTDPGQRLPILRQVLIASGAVARIIETDPVKMNDDELDDLTKGYRLIHIRRTGARTGPGGPGDLAWVWPLATMILLPLALRRRRR